MMHVFVKVHKLKACIITYCDGYTFTLNKTKSS